MYLSIRRFAGCYIYLFIYLFQEGFWNVDDLTITGINKSDFVNFLVNAGAQSLGKSGIS